MTITYRRRIYVVTTEAEMRLLLADISFLEELDAKKTA